MLYCRFLSIKNIIFVRLFILNVMDFWKEVCSFIILSDTVPPLFHRKGGSHIFEIHTADKCCDFQADITKFDHLEQGERILTAWNITVRYCSPSVP